MEGGDAATLLTHVGIMNKLSTGNTALDIVLCMLFPILMTQLTPYWEAFKRWMSKSGEPTALYTRSILHVKRDGWYYSNEDDPPNNLLQQAILMYLGSKPELIRQYSAAQLALVKRGRDAPRGSPRDDCDSDSESDDYYCYDTSKQLKTFRVNTMPPVNTWVNVEDGVDFQRVESEAEVGEANKKTNTVIAFYLQSNAADGQRRIDAFVNAAYTYYQAQMSESSVAVRYLYTPYSGAPPAPQDGAKADTLVYRRYVLSDEKTFASLFHPDKDAILRLIDAFIRKDGKYAIPGYGHKLGLLLYGPPGTGKTSLIKALAQYTDRSIISIPLSKVKTNQELMDIVFDQNFAVVGEALASKLPFGKTVFVMEDVDAAASVVQRRSPARPSMAPLSHSGSTVSQKGGGRTLRKAAEELADVAEDKDEGPVQGPQLPGEMAKISKLFDDPDKLNLAGLLNVLDGVVDCPNRIVVLTTNHPEKLDPALIRPGRINKKIYMGYLRLEEAWQMVRHYFPGVAFTAAQESAFNAAFVDGVMSPAELEMLAADADTVDELVDALQAQF